MKPNQYLGSTVVPHLETGTYWLLHHSDIHQDVAVIQHYDPIKDRVNVLCLTHGVYDNVTVHTHKKTLWILINKEKYEMLRNLS